MITVSPDSDRGIYIEGNYSPEDSPGKAKTLINLPGLDIDD
jgi:hypothetical protein